MPRTINAHHSSVSKMCCVDARAEPSPVCTTNRWIELNTGSDFADSRGRISHRLKCYVGQVGGRLGVVHPEKLDRIGLRRH